MTTKQQTIADFIAAQSITMTAERVDRNPNMDQDAADRMDHWRCTFRRDRRAFTTYYSMGYGHNGRAPSAADVLNCLADDAASVANARSFEDWASDMGWDPDSRKAERTYRLIERQALRLTRFLDDDAAYQDLLYNTKRL